MSERLAPDAILVQTGLTGTVSAIQDDPDAPDANWLTSAAGNNTELRVSFPSPSATLQTGAGLQEVRVLVRSTGQSTAPTAVVELWENGGAAALATLVASTTISAQRVLAGTFDAALLTDPTGAKVEVRVVGTVGGGKATNRAAVEVGAVEWNATVSSSTPYSATADAEATIDAAAGGGGGAITLSGVTQVNSAGTKTTSFSINVPTHTDGDLLLLVIVNMGPDAPTQPAGWTELDHAFSGDGTSSGDARITVYHRTAASEPAAYTITQGYSWYGAAMLAYSGAGSIEAHSVNGSPAAGSNSLTALSVTSGGAGRRLLTLWGQNKYPASGGGFIGDQAAGFVVEAATDDTNIGMEVDDGTVGSGATGDHSNTPANLSSEPWAAMQVLVAPAVQGTPYSATADAELTVTALASLTATADAEVTVVRPAGNWFTDTFSRTSASGWGTSDTGAVWGDADDIADFTVDGSRGVITLPDSSSPHNNTIAEGSINAVDSTGRVTWAMDTLPAAGWVTMLRFYSRRGLDLGDTGDTDADDIRHAIRFRDNGSLELQHDYSINAVRTTVNATWYVTGKVYTPGDLWHARYEVTGSAPAITARIRIWKDGDPEPSTWDLEETFDPGSTGVDHGGTTGAHLQTSASNTAFPVHVYVDDWTFDDLVSGTPYTAVADAEVNLTAAYSAVVDAAASVTADYLADADAQISVGAAFAADADAAASITAAYQHTADAAVAISAGFRLAADAAVTLTAPYIATADAAASITQSYIATADAEVSALHEFVATGDVSAQISADYRIAADAAAQITAGLLADADAAAQITASLTATGDAEATVLHVGFSATSDVSLTVSAAFSATADAASLITADYLADADAQATVLHVSYEATADASAQVTADYIEDADAQTSVTASFEAAVDVESRVTASLTERADAETRITADLLATADAEATFPAAVSGTADVEATVLHVGYEATADVTATVAAAYAHLVDAEALVAEPYSVTADAEVGVRQGFITVADAELQITAALAVIGDAAVTITEPFTARSDAETGILAVYYRGADVEAQITESLVSRADAETTVEVAFSASSDVSAVVTAGYRTASDAVATIGTPLLLGFDARAVVTATFIAQADAEATLIEANFIQYGDAAVIVRNDYPLAFTKRGAAFSGRAAMGHRGAAFIGRGDPTTHR